MVAGNPRMVPPSMKLARAVAAQLIGDCARAGKRGIPLVLSIERGIQGMKRYHLHALFAPRHHGLVRYLERRLGLHGHDYGFSRWRQTGGLGAVLDYTIKHQTRQDAVGAWVVPARGQRRIMNLDGYDLDTELDGDSRPSWRLRQPVALTRQRSMRFEEASGPPPIMPGQRQLELT